MVSPASPADPGLPSSRRALREARTPAAPPARRPQPRRRRRRTARWVWLAVLVVVVLALALAAWVAFRALTVKDELQTSRALIAQVEDGRTDVKDAVIALGAHARAAADAAGDPAWALAELVPFAGDNLRGVRLAAQALDVAVNQLGVPVLTEFDAESDEPVLARVLPDVSASVPEVTRIAAELAQVRESSALIGPVRDGVDEVGDVMDGVAPLVELLPELLGANGPRNYLLVFQNNAESVGLGGSAASQTLVRAENGSIEILGQADSDPYANGTAVDVEVPQSALDLYSDYLVDHINTSASRPDFPTMARIVSAWWQRDIAPDEIDGVISIDPIALSRMLLATGPIELATGDELTQKNAVDLLLSDVYERWGTDAQKRLADAFFASVAVNVFDKLASGAFDVKDMIWAVGEGIDQGNIMFYSADPAVQAKIEPLRLAGILPVDNAASTTIGVYFRDESASKIDYYMKSAVDVTQTCGDGRRVFATSVTLHLDISQRAADALPQYVQSQTGGSSQFRTQVYVYGPPGTTVESAQVDGREVSVRSDDVVDLDHPVAWFETDLAPGESATVTATFAGDDGDYGPLELRTTPMINKTATQLESQGCAAP